jgi:hypothetical protein
MDEIPNTIHMFDEEAKLKTAPDAAAFIFRRLYELVKKGVVANDSATATATTQRSLYGLNILWLVASRYNLLKKGFDPFHDLVKLYRHMANMNGNLELPDVGAALVEMVQTVYPRAMANLPAGQNWQPTCEDGLYICRYFNSLSLLELLSPTQTSNKDPRLLSGETWLQAVAPIISPTNIPNGRVRLVENEFDGYRQLSMWDNVANDNKLPIASILPVIPPPSEPETEKSLSEPPGLIFVTEYNPTALLTQFEQLVSYYQRQNAEIGLVEASGASQLDMFNYLQQTADRAEPETDIPVRCLQHFRAAPGLDDAHRYAAALTLWECAFDAYTRNVSLYRALPDWELL